MLLKARGIKVSMSRKGDCWDNALMESVNGTFKVECVHGQHFQARAQPDSPSRCLSISVGVDGDNPGVEIIHRGKAKTLTREQRRWLKRRQAIEPVIGYLNADHRMNRCWLKGAVGDAINAVLSAAGYNRRWLLRAVPAVRIRGFYFVWILVRLLRGVWHTVGIRLQNDLGGSVGRRHRDARPLTVLASWARAGRGPLEMTG
jgi:hypothetical protein